MNSKKLKGAIILLLLFSIGICYLTLFSVKNSEEHVIPRIISYTSYLETNTIKFFVVVGEVQNNLTKNIKSVIINATFYDDTNNILGKSYSYATLKILTPNQISPFKIYWVLNASVNIPKRIELTCMSIQTNEQPMKGIVITNRTSYTDERGYYIVKGKIRNKGSRKASLITIFCTYYDENGNIIAISKTYLNSTLTVGEEAIFKVSLKPLKHYPSHYKLIIIANYQLLLKLHYHLFFIIVIAFIIFLIYMKNQGW